MGRSDLMFNSRNTMTGSQVITSFYVFSRHESLTQTDVMDCVLVLTVVNIEDENIHRTTDRCPMYTDHHSRLDWSWPGLKRDGWNERANYLLSWVSMPGHTNIMHIYG